jgi:hypothetical protein
MTNPAGSASAKLMAMSERTSARPLTDRRTRSDILTPFNWFQERGIAVGLATVGGKPRVVAVPEGMQVTSVIVSIELVDLRLKGP